MSSATVWVVDDDRSIRWVLEKALQGAGLEHAVFDSAKAARKALEANTPTVVMTDIRMPGEDGLSLLEHFHRFAWTSCHRDDCALRPGQRGCLL